MIRAVPCVPDRHIMEQTMFCAQDVFGPVAHLPASAAHAPRPPVLQPQIFPWDEVPAQIFQACRGHIRRNLLVPLPPSGAAKLVLKYLTISIVAPLGRWLVAGTMSSIVEAPSSSK